MGRAAEKCAKDLRKRIEAEDIIYALHGLKFHHYAEYLALYYERFLKDGEKVEPAEEV